MATASRKTRREAPPHRKKTLRTAPCTERECPKRRPRRRKNVSGGSPTCEKRCAACCATLAICAACDICADPIICAVPRAPSAQRMSSAPCALPKRSCRRPRCMRHLHSARHTVRNTITMIQAKPIRSVGANTVPSISALVTVAETGSTVPIRLARTLPMSLTPCI